MEKEFYKILSLIFHKPDREFAGYLRSGFSEDIGLLDAEANFGFANFIDKNRLKSDEEFYEMLAVEYTRLFTTAIPGVPCPPYESIYRENEVMGNSTISVLECYNQAGLRVMEKFHDLPDHVAVELEFLYYLRNYGYNEEFNAFMNEHFSKWVLKFCEEVEKNDSIGFYGSAAAMLRKFVNNERWKQN
jgi:TorA maturation chaperone TorD